MGPCGTPGAPVPRHNQGMRHHLLRMQRITFRAVTQQQHPLLCIPPGAELSPPAATQLRQTLVPPSTEQPARARRWQRVTQSCSGELGGHGWAASACLYLRCGSRRQLPPCRSCCWARRRSLRRSESRGGCRSPHQGEAWDRGHWSSSRSCLLGSENTPRAQGSALPSLGKAGPKTCHAG